MPSVQARAARRFLELCQGQGDNTDPRSTTRCVYPVFRYKNSLHGDNTEFRPKWVFCQQNRGSESKIPTSVLANSL